VMDLDRPDYRAPGTLQISGGGLLYITVLGLGDVLHGRASIGWGGSMHRDIRNYAVR